MRRAILFFMLATSLLISAGRTLPVLAIDAQPLSKERLISKWGKPKVEMKMKSPAVTESGIRFDESLAYYIDFDDGHGIIITAYFYNDHLLDIDYDTTTSSPPAKLEEMPTNNLSLGSVWGFVSNNTQELILVALIFTLFIYLKIWWQARKGVKAQNLYGLIDFLQRPELRRARRVLLELGRSSKPYGSWTRDEKVKAADACAGYDIAGILAKRGIVKEEYVMDEWAWSIRDCYLAASELITEYRKTYESEKYWDDFERLGKKAYEKYPKKQ